MFKQPLRQVMSPFHHRWSPFVRPAKPQWQKVLLLFGRVLFSLLFLISALYKIFSFQGTVQYMAAHGITWLTPFWLVAAIVIELFGAFSLALGWKTRWGALALLVFLIPTTLIFHTNFPKEMWDFFKNLALMGALLFWIGNGPGELSLEETKEESFARPHRRSQPLAPLRRKEVHPLAHPLELWHRMVESFFTPFFEEPFEEFIQTDIYEKDKNLVVELALPGLDPKKVNIEVEDQYLKVSGEVEERKGHFWNQEIHKGSFSQVIHLPVEVDGSQAKAEYQKGILRITLPRKKEKETIRVQVLR